VFVPPERLDGWFARFADRHGPLTWAPGPASVLVTAADGAVADCAVPFPPLAVDPAVPDGGLAAHAGLDRRVGVLLVRLGGHAAGVFDGSRLVVSKVGSRQVHGRSAAGGWSQQRFARRREGQAEVALSAAAGIAARILLPAAPTLHTVVTGGDRQAVAAVLADPRLRALLPLLSDLHLDVPDPRLKVLQQVPQQFRAVRVHVTDPAGPPEASP
jgi:hypothetical protein